ncbi:Pre-mRNA-splicing factor cwf23 [Psilocybe cubensis]|uniref:Pre-mRNA-splicing factor cwf23 n=2 Tax=Psilocybe cubensis TaxID=181762 RepID=A0ACB8GTY3_PSICU|nr:Pre-mRNA-splicing factor cwf23 [Psilocybe cubensis]KAH9478676.1 Pre-mRNA-splicing factor cwf23 [Psilocybe cubensis]
MSSAVDEEVNPYELLDVKTEATEQEIRTAYRQRSLKVHPDRNPNNPDAARKFHELNQAYELLLDPLRRLALDAKLRVKLARKERFKAYDNKRKNLVEELEERERAFKKSRMDKQKEEVETWHETERIKEEGKRLREQKEQELRNRMQPPSFNESVKSDDEEEAPPAMDSLDTTIRLKYPLKTHPTLTTPSAIATLLSRFGATDETSIVLSLKSKVPEKPPKFGTALVPFKQIGDAFAAVCASGRKEMGMDGVKITWVNDKEPEILGWLRRTGKLGSGVGASGGASQGSSTTNTPPSNVATPDRDNGVKAGLPQHQTHHASASPFSSFPSSFPETFPSPELKPVSAAPGIDYESLTLMRMRQAERERLEREILEQEANE